MIRVALLWTVEGIMALIGATLLLAIAGSIVKGFHDRFGPVFPSREQVALMAGDIVSVAVTIGWLWWKVVTY